MLPNAMVLVARMAVASTGPMEPPTMRNSVFIPDATPNSFFGHDSTTTLIRETMHSAMPAPRMAWESASSRKVE